MRLALLLLLISFSAFSQNDPGLRFIENKGQWNDEIDFQAQVPGGRVGVSANGFRVVLLDMEAAEHQHMAGHGHVSELTGHDDAEGVNGHYFQINLLGANTNSRPRAEGPLTGYHNYFLGNDPCRWASNARGFNSVVYSDVYEGIDMRVSSVGRNLKYDFIVSPGADPAQIRIQYLGVEGIEMPEDELVIRTSVGTLTETKPYSYQSNGATNHTIASAYHLSDNTVSFFFPEEYDECRELVIDPLLIFSTYSGSTADNWGSTATPGEHGTLYSAGVTKQDLGGFFPATVGAFQTSNHGGFDMGINKYDSAGTRFLYATYLGGSNNDSPQSLVVDKNSGDLLVLGISSSPNYPVSPDAFDNTFNNGSPIFNRVLNTTDEWDIVLTRLSKDGDQLIGSTFLGGSANDGLNLPKQAGGALVVNYGDEMRGDVITDESGHVYISSVTSSSDFPIINGFDNAFGGGVTDGLVVKLTPDLSSIVWSSYVGGAGFDAAYSIKFDSDGNLMLAGGTTSNDFPVTPGSYQSVFNGIVDGWIARISADGSSVMNATFTGTPSFDQVYFVDLNGDGDIYCYGQTAGQMPVTAGVYKNNNSGQFLQKFSSDLSTLVFSTVFGSGTTNGLIIPNISPTAFLVNDCDNIYMAGWGGFINSSPSTGFWQSTTHGMPVTNDAHQKTTSGSDFYFMVLNGDATKLVYSTYFGGNASKTHVDGGTSRFDKYGIVYHAVCSGCSFGNTSGGPSSDFPTTPNAHSRFNRSLNCNNAAFKFDLSSLRAIFDTNNTALTMPGFNHVCYPDSIVFQNFSTGGKTIEWDFGDGTLLQQTDTDPRNVIHQYKQQGEYLVKLKITDLSTCSQSDSTSKLIYYYKDNISVGEDDMVCEGANFQLTASGGVDYSWISQDGTFSSVDQNPIVQPSAPTTYYVTVVDANNCSRKDTVNLGVIQNVRARFETFHPDSSTPGYNDVCYPDPIRFTNQSVNAETYVWNFGDGTTFPQTTADPVSMLHLFREAGTYQVTLRAFNPNTCNKEDVAVKTINYFKSDLRAMDDATICAGTTIQLNATGGIGYQWSTENFEWVTNLSAPQVQPLKTTTYYVKSTDANGCIGRDTTLITVLDSVELKWQHHLIANCTDRPVVVVENLAAIQPEATFQFDFGDGTITSDAKVEHTYDVDGSYLVKLTGQRGECVYEESVELPIYKLRVPNVFTPDDSPGMNDHFEIRFGETEIGPADVGYAVRLVVYERWGRPVYESNDYRNNWNAADLGTGVYYFQVKVGELASCKSWVHVVK